MRVIGQPTNHLHTMNAEIIIAIQPLIRAAHLGSISRRDAGRKPDIDRAIIRASHKCCGNTWWPSVVAAGDIALRLDWRQCWPDHVSGRGHPIYSIVRDGAEVGTYCPEPYAEPIRIN